MVVKENPRKDCPRCGLENAKFGRNRTRRDGLSAYCLMCMRDYYLNYTPRNWAEVNRKRRSNPEYRDKERKRANELDRQKRKSDRAYVKERSSSNRIWKNTGDVDAKRLRANELKRLAYRRKRDAIISADPTFLERMRANQREGRRKYNSDPEPWAIGKQAYS